MHERRVWLSFFLPFLGVCFAATTQRPEKPSDRDIVFPPPQQHVALQRGEKCIGNAYTLFGKAWQAGWVDGGLTRDASGKGARLPTFPDIFGFSPAASPAGRTSLLVIDQFAPSKITLGKTVPGLEVSHGQLVVAHIRSLLESAGFRPEAPTDRSHLSQIRAPLGVYFYGNAATGRHISIWILDLSFFADSSSPYGLIKVSSIAPVFQAFVTRDPKLQHNRFTFGLPPYQPRENVVINMSFAMIPCEAAVAFADSKAEDENANVKNLSYLDSFAQKLQALPANAGLSKDQLLNQLFTVKLPHPFVSMLQNSVAQLRKDRNTIAVAASGNYGLTLSTYPGRLAEVLSVGAMGWNKPSFPKASTPSDKLYWSDRGDLYSVGGWFTIPQRTLQRYCADSPYPNCVSTNLGSTDFSNFGYQGTSFSAPALATYFALRMKSGTPCYPNSGKGFVMCSSQP